MLRHFLHDERMPDDEADWGRNLLGLYTYPPSNECPELSPTPTEPKAKIGLPRSCCNQVYTRRFHVLTATNMQLPYHNNEQENEESSPPFHRTSIA